MIKLSDVKSFIREALKSNDNDICSAEAELDAMSDSLPEELIPACRMTQNYFSRIQDSLEKRIEDAYEQHMRAMEDNAFGECQMDEPPIILKPDLPF